MQVDYVIGNSYDKIPKARAKLDRSGAYLKQHDWTLYVDVLGPDPDIVKKVEFHSECPRMWVFLTPSCALLTRIIETIQWGTRSRRPSLSRTVR